MAVTEAAVAAQAAATAAQAAEGAKRSVAAHAGTLVPVAVLFLLIAGTRAVDIFSRFVAEVRAVGRRS
jgi:hypothetical protein